jgi:hypothetical protein
MFWCLLTVATNQDFNSTTSLWISVVFVIGRSLQLTFTMDDLLMSAFNWLSVIPTVYDTVGIF